MIRMKLISREIKSRKCKRELGKVYEREGSMEACMGESGGISSLDKEEDTLLSDLRRRKRRKMKM